MRRPLALLVSLAALALLAAGCGVPLSPGAQRLSRSGLPAALAGVNASPTTSSSTTTTTTPAKANDRLVIYLLDSSSDRLVAVARDWPPPITESTALNVLVIGPNAREKNLTTDVAPSASLAVRVEGGVAGVRLDSSFSTLSGPQLYLGLAQIVYTLMVNFRTIKAVNFALDGVPYNYTPSGSVDLQPVTMKTYESVGPLPAKKPATAH